MNARTAGSRAWLKLAPPSSLQQNQSSHMSRYLHSFPNYAGSSTLLEVDADEVDARAFRRRYTRSGTPVVIRGAARAWRACREWTLPALKRRLTGVQNLFQRGGLLVTAPFPEYAGDEMLGDRAKLLERNLPLSGRDFLARVQNGEELTAYGVDLSIDGIEPLRRDIGALAFLGRPLEIEPKRDGSGMHYVPRLFLHAGGYTDWHFHYADDTVTVQACGEKEFLLVPPDPRSFRAMWRVARRRGFYDLRPEDRDVLRDVRPLRATLRPGDAIFLPVFWWHAVEATGPALGATLAFPFRASRRIQYDLRLPGPRWNLQQAWQRRYWHLLAPLTLLAAAAVIRKPLSWTLPSLPR